MLSVELAQISYSWSTPAVIGRRTLTRCYSVEGCARCWIHSSVRVYMRHSDHIMRSVLHPKTGSHDLIAFPPRIGLLTSSQPTLSLVLCECIVVVKHDLCGVSNEISAYKSHDPKNVLLSVCCCCCVGTKIEQTHWSACVKLTQNFYFRPDYKQNARTHFEKS